jgi:hypothetical protein
MKYNLFLETYEEQWIASVANPFSSKRFAKEYGDMITGHQPWRYRIKAIRKGKKKVVKRLVQNRT